MRTSKNTIFFKVLVYVTDVQPNSDQLVLKSSKGASLVFSCVCTEPHWNAFHYHSRQFILFHPSFENFFRRIYLNISQSYAFLWILKIILKVYKDHDKDLFMTVFDMVGVLASGLQIYNAKHFQKFSSISVRVLVLIIVIDLFNSYNNYIYTILIQSIIRQGEVDLCIHLSVFHPMDSLYLPR